MPDAVLKVAGREYTGWTGLTVTRHMQTVAGTFEFSLTDKYPGQHDRFAFRLGLRCQVLLEGQQVIDGYLDRVAGSYQKDTHTLTVSGRSRVADLADCPHLGTPAQWQGLTLPEIAREVCRPFAIEVAAEADPGEPFQDARTSEGQTVLSFLAGLARQRGFLVLGQPDGRLGLVRAGTQVQGALRLGANVLGASWEQGDQERHSLYVVKGQGAQTALPDLDIELSEAERADLYALHQEGYAAPEARVTDPAVRRYRPTVILADQGTQADYQKLAAWEAASRAGRSRSWTYQAQGWGPGAGRLWRVNQLVEVTDAFAGLSGARLLLESITYGLDPDTGSTSSQMGLVHPDAYLPEPKMPQAAQALADITGDFDS